MGSDAETKEAHALYIVMQTPGIFIMYFIATVIYFCSYGSICENEEIQTYLKEYCIFKKAFWGSGGEEPEKHEVGTV